MNSLTQLAAILGILFLISLSAAIRQVEVCKNLNTRLFQADIHNCNQYIDCKKDVPRVGECKAPYLFDANEQMCNYPSKVDCISSKNTTALSTHAFPGLCHRYVLWFNGQPLLRECQSGLLYNALTDRCDLAQRVDCAADVCKDVDGVKFVPSKQKCDKYYMCFGSTPIERSCDEVSQFNRTLLACDLIEESPMKCHIKLSAVPFARMPPQHAQVLCPKNGQRFIPDKKNQNRYFYCVNGKSAVLTCTPGLVYDPTVEECRRPIKPKPKQA